MSPPFESDGATEAPAVVLPDREEFGKALAPGAGRHRAVVELHGLLTRRAGVDDSSLPEGLDEGARAFERTAALLRWVAAGRKPPAIEAYEPPAVTRLRLVVLAFERFPEIAHEWAKDVGRVVAETPAVRLLAEVGVPNDRGLLHETTDRLARRFLPRPPDRGDLADLFGRALLRRRDAEGIRLVPPELVRRLAAALGDVWGPLRESAIDSVALLTTRISALGLTEEMRARTPDRRLRASPFFRLPKAPPPELGRVVAECRAAADEVLRQLEHTGVSVDVVYCVDAIRRGLDRVEALLPFTAPEGGAREVDSPTATEPEAAPAPPDPAVPPAVSALLTALVVARAADRSLVDILRGNLRLLARKVIERAGHTGEHYVTWSRREWWGMIASAGGGGALTAATCAIKFLVKWGHFPLFVDGMLTGLNYAVSFLLIQLFGFTLATKQPSMTAAMLAGAIREAKDDRQLDDLVSLIARISRSQFAAAVGNIAVVVPAAIALDLAISSSKGHSFLSEEQALHVVASTHLLESGSVFFAALTGVLLWASSLGAGWLENWVVYRRIPEAIEHHRFGRLVGRRTMRWLSRFLTRHVAGFGGNVSLGFLLGMTPVLGVFFGLPLDIRHVTLSTGALTLAGVSLGFSGVASLAFVHAALGVLVIGLLNFTVSFLLALLVAFRAREVEGLERLRLLVAVLRRLGRSPREFFLPPPETTPR